MPQIITKTFSLGQIVATPSALEVINKSSQSPLEFIDRHRKCDWGEVGAEDWRLNDEAVSNGDRLLSSYYTLEGVKVWVITEADRSSSCILLPEEY